MELYKTRSSNAQKCKKRRNTGMGKRGDNKNFKKEKIGWSFNMWISTLNINSLNTPITDRGEQKWWNKSGPNIFSLKGMHFKHTYKNKLKVGWLQRLHHANINY